MDLTDLELVVAVADAGSITHGATRAHLSLPSASARLRHLEATLGARLFERHRRGAAPTSAGALLVRHARPLLRDVERMRLELAEHGGGVAQTIRLAANVSATAGILAPALAGFLAEHHDVRIDVEQLPGAEVAGAVAERRADLGLLSDAVDLGGLTTQVLRPDPLVLLTAPGDPLAGRASVRFADVVGRSFVGLADVGSFPIDDRPVFRARLANIEAVCEAVGHGVGVAILPRHTVSGPIAGNSVIAIEIDERWARRDLLLCHAEGELSAAATELRAALMDAAP
jgi:DNA-binding transcriptional LysR family regulator